MLPFDLTALSLKYFALKEYSLSKPSDKPLCNDFQHIDGAAVVWI